MKITKFNSKKANLSQQVKTIGIGQLLVQTICLSLGLMAVQGRIVAQEAPNIIWVSYNDDQDDQPAADAASNGFTQASDHVYTELLRAAGAHLTRHLTADGDPPADLFNQADLVIVSRAVVSGQYDDEATAWNTTIKAPVLMLSGYILRDNRMGFTSGNTMVDTVDLIKLKAEAPTHPVFKGIELDGDNLMLNDYAGIVTHNGIVQRGLSVNNNPIISAGNLIATVGTETDPTFGGMIIGEWDEGTLLIHDGSEENILAGKRMAFLTGSREINAPVSTAGLFDLESDGEQLFFNAVNYMAGSNLIAPPRVTAVNPRNNTIHAETDGGFSFKAVSAEPIPADGIQVIINNQDVTGSLIIGNDPLARTVSYDRIQANRAYNIEITITNGTGSRVVAVGFDTFDPDQLVYIEAENFNFGGGSYFDSMVLCNDFGGTVAGCYFDRVSEQGVDALDSNGFSDDRDYNFDAMPPEIFRYGGSAGRDEAVDTFLSSDLPREIYTSAADGSNGAILDYDLDLIGPGDWWNYTRTIESGTYSAILRVSSASDAEFELSLVTSNPAQGNQTLRTLGHFVVSGRPGYQSVTLTNTGAGPASFEANGKTTLRLSANSGVDAKVNYLIMAPYSEEITPSSLEGIALNQDGGVTISWSGQGGIESTSSLKNPNWQPVSNATSPYTVAPSDQEAYYRVAQ